MSFENINRRIAAAGGDWVKLTKTSHPVLKGKLVEAEERNQKDMKGNDLVSQKTGNVRIEWVLTLDVDGKTKKVSIKESAQQAIRAALTTAGVKGMAAGGYLQLAVVKDSEQGVAQAEYKAKYTPPTAADPFDAPGTADSDEPPF